jgi:AcrR family transcriptional regulator
MPRVTQEHRDAQRVRILDAALTCFDRSGLHGTTMQEIVRESGLSPGAIYSYFDGKSAIIEAIAEARHEHERALLFVALENDDPRAAVHAFLGDYFDWIAEPDEQRRRRVNVYVWAEALHSDRVSAIVTEGLAPIGASALAVRSAAREGRFPRDVDPESFVRALLALILGFVLQQAWDPTVDVGRYRTTVLTMVDALFDAQGS